MVGEVLNFIGFGFCKAKLRAGKMSQLTKVADRVSS